MIVSSDEEIYEKKYGTTLFRKPRADRKSTRLNSSHSQISYAVFCLKKKNHQQCVVEPLLAAVERDRPDAIASAGRVLDARLDHDPVAHAEGVYVFLDVLGDLGAVRA